jgi:hypothetical protein
MGRYTFFLHTIYFFLPVELNCLIRVGRLPFTIILRVAIKKIMNIIVSYQAISYSLVRILTTYVIWVKHDTLRKMLQQCITPNGNPH